MSFGLKNNSIFIRNGLRGKAILVATIISIIISIIIP